LKIPLTSNLSVTYLGENFRGQRMWCDIYDNSKIKKYVPNWECKVSFKEGIKHTFNWLMEDQARMRFNPELNKILNDLTLKNMDNAY
jgi:nucleoside-diphosphate-sugar epimerase